MRLRDYDLRESLSSRVAAYFATIEARNRPQRAGNKWLLQRRLNLQYAQEQASEGLRLAQIKSREAPRRAPMSSERSGRQPRIQVVTITTTAGSQRSTFPISANRPAGLPAQLSNDPRCDPAERRFERPSSRTTRAPARSRVLR